MYRKKGSRKKINNIVTLVIIHRNNRDQCKKCRRTKKKNHSMQRDAFSLVEHKQTNYKKNTCCFTTNYTSRQILKTEPVNNLQEINNTFLSAIVLHKRHCSNERKSKSAIIIRSFHSHALTHDIHFKQNR